MSKWCGNWAAASSIAETEKDFKKIREDKKYSYPALALSVWLWATPSQSNDPFYSWIFQQIEKEEGSWETSLKKEEPSCLTPDFTTGSFQIDTKGNRAFEKLEVFCVGVYNDKVKSK